MEKYNAPLTKEAFLMACQIEDLTMIKTLVKVAKKRNSIQNTTGEALVQKNEWHQWMFGHDNIHTKVIILNEHCQLRQYLLQLYREVNGKELPKIPHNSGETYEINDDVKNSKLVYDLQLKDKDERSLNVLLVLNQAKSLALFLVNHKKIAKTIHQFGSTHLSYLAWKGNADVLKILIKYGIQVNPMIDNKTNPLHCAAIHGHAKVAKVLLDNKANVDSMYYHKSSPSHHEYHLMNPLHCASIHGHVEVAKV